MFIIFRLRKLSGPALKNKLSETAKEKKKEEKTNGLAHYPRLGCAAPSSLPTCSAYIIPFLTTEKVF
jgi:hypothetical protein